MRIEVIGLDTVAGLDIGLDSVSVLAMVIVTGLVLLCEFGLQCWRVCSDDRLQEPTSRQGQRPGGHGGGGDWPGRPV